MAQAQSTPDLKEEVRRYWDSEPCGTRYLGGQEDLEAHARTRYALEPYIPEFARFACARGLRVLEIGVGMGADYLQWLKNGALATGIDLSAESLAKTRLRCERAGYRPDLRLADAEQLPFSEDTFDVVYSYGVMHHSPNTQQCIREACRVLKPGGQLRVMLYHHPSLTGLMLWLRYGLLQGWTMRKTVFEQLESPGTKTFTRKEAELLMTGLEDISVRQVFSPGDLLQHQPSARFQSVVYRWIWKVYPRTLMRSLFPAWGLFLLISARKPEFDGTS